ncbi:hypothetical protein OKW96_20410 [Sphingobacterium sp. KU25419]|nr:hypothetical protein OKW96_20410 [Sphingobacterium sp. KU25419]
MLPLFIKYFDDGCKDPNYIPIASQNISTLEAGANAKVFGHLIDFLELQTIIITDIDATHQKGSNYWTACTVSDGKNTSNQTIKHYFRHDDAIKIESNKSGKKITEKQVKAKQKELTEKWFTKIVDEKIETNSPHIKIAYQTNEAGYHGRSFEDAFISINKDFIFNYKMKYLV